MQEPFGSGREQAALRRIATLVAQGVQPDVFFGVVAEEVGRVVDAPSVAVARYESDSTVSVCGAFPSQEPLFRTGTRVAVEGANVLGLVRDRATPARVDDYEKLEGEIADAVRRSGLRSSVGVPIVVARRVWGAIVASSTERLPENTGPRLAEFTELVAAAIASMEAREALARLAAEQAALRRVATLVAKEDLPEKVFAKVAEETGRLLGGVECTLLRSERDGAAANVGTWGEEISAVFPLETRFFPVGDGVAATVLRTGRPYRIDDYSAVEDPIARSARDRGIESSVGCPIVVRGAIWGAVVVGTTGSEPFPPDTELRLTQFADLVATAVANAEARGEIVSLVDEQAALRRVATLVAEGAPPDVLFRAVTDEVAQVVGPPTATLSHHHADGSFTVVAATNNPAFPVGSRWTLDGPSLAATIHETGRTARIDDYSNLGGAVAAAMHGASLRAAAGSPIVVDGKVWGHISVAAKGAEPLPAGSEQRLLDFTELISNAISNAEARDALAQLADEQAALRRVATLVARGTEPVTLFSTVCSEAQALLGAERAGILRFHDDRTVTVLANTGEQGEHNVGARISFDPGFVVGWVHETHQAARFDTDDPTAADMPEIVRTIGIRSAVGGPIVVDGELWGVITLASLDRPLPSGMERRLADFTELVATAIANAESKSELAASRRRIVTAADEERRRIQRDLHDGIQQRLIALSFRTRAMMQRPPDELPAFAAELSEGLQDASDELREISRGIHPTILTRAGLGPALRALGGRSDVPIEVDVKLDERLPAPTAAAAYYIASEALTNVAKHAHANVVHLIASDDKGILTLEVRDDGVGGVDASRGSGILGLTDRVEALGGTISINSPPRGGTTLSVRLPIET